MITKRFWALGFNSNKERLEEFKKENYWAAFDYDHTDESNVAKKARRKFNQISQGDYIAIKGYGGTHDLIVHYLGEVTSVDKTNYRLQLKPFEKPLYKGKAPRGENAGNWHDTLLEIKRSDIINLIFSENKMENKSNHKEYIELLEHKKQIILQGPPGTGKTRLAKELAKELVGKDNTQLKKALVVGSKILNASGVQEYYTIKTVKENSVVLNSERAKLDWEPTYEKIIEKLYQLKNGETPTNVNGLHPYELAVAKYLYNTGFNQSKNYQLIQFHPSYSYEDFVRGISVKNNENNKIEYKTENKILAKIAKEALENYTDYHKETASLSKEVKLKEYFNLFIDYIEDKIEANNDFFKLTDNVGLLSLDEDAFRYKGNGDGWSKRGDRMLFKDIKQAFLDGNTERQDLRKNTSLSGLAKQHASYFVRVLNMFQQFLKDENLTFENTTVEKEPLKSYVLIIDEINRANLSSVLGELIYALEYRGEPVESMYEKEGEGTTLILPPNLYIIGTMNTADRSVGQIDYAFRRRFAFVDVLPKEISQQELKINRKENEPELIFNVLKFREVSKLFVSNDGLKGEKLLPSEYLSEEFKPKDVWLGHSYFIYERGNFNMNLEYEIKPILREYVADGILKESALKVIEELKPHL